MPPIPHAPLTPAPQSSNMAPVEVKQPEFTDERSTRNKPRTWASAVAATWTWLVNMVLPRGRSKGREPSLLVATAGVESVAFEVVSDGGEVSGADKAAALAHYTA